MRRLIMITALIASLASPAAAQHYWGPYQPYAHTPRLYYYNPGAPPYPFLSGPVYVTPYYGPVWRGYHSHRGYTGGYIR